MGTTFTDSDRATLKVAYAILTLDGAMQGDEIKVFRKIAEGFPGFSAGEEETNKLLLESFAIGNELTALKRVYSDDELLRAFAIATLHDCEIIKQSRSTAKKAFAIWIAISLADHNYSEIERKAIKILQKQFSANAGLPTTLPIFAGLASIAKIGELTGDTAIADKLKDFGKSNVISDFFLSEMEDSLKLLSALKEQMLNCHESRKPILQKSYDEIIASIKETITSKED